MTIKDTLNNSIKKLENVSDFSDLDAEILLSFVLKKNKEYLFANPEKKLNSEQLKNFEKLIERRRKHEPIAYIINNKEFFGIDFFVDKRVLIPRPETEILVEEVIKMSEEKTQLTIVDVGTGSGCIAISLAKNLENAKIYAIDISKDALEIAKINAEKNKVKIEFLSGNLLEPLENTCPPESKERRRDKIDIICANLPYITVEQLNLTEEDVRKFEPKTALIAEEETTLYSELLDQAPKYLNDNGIIFLEIDPVFKDKIIKLVQEKIPNAKYKIENDLSGLGRVLIIRT